MIEIIEQTLEIKSEDHDHEKGKIWDSQKSQLQNFGL